MYQAIKLYNLYIEIWTKKASAIAFWISHSSPVNKQVGQAGYPFQGYVFVEIRDSKQKPYSFKLNIEHREPVDIGLEVQLKPCKV